MPVQRYTFLSPATRSVTEVISFNENIVPRRKNQTIDHLRGNIYLTSSLKKINQVQNVTPYAPGIVIILPSIENQKKMILKHPLKF